MLTPKMKRIADDIGKSILQDYDRDYLSLILANGLIIEDIIFQVLVECCRYAYLLKAEKHPLKYYIERDGLELDLARKEIKRTSDYTNEKFDLVEKEHKKNFEDKLLRPDFSKVKEKNRYPAYDFSEFQYWRKKVPVTVNRRHRRCLQRNSASVD